MRISQNIIIIKPAFRRSKKIFVTNSIKAHDLIMRPKTCVVYMT